MAPANTMESPELANVKSVWQNTIVSPELRHVKSVWEKMQHNSPIYNFLLSDVEIVSASKGTVTSRLTLSENHLNSRGTIHGAVSATLADWSGGLAIASYGLEKTGASIDINVQYIGKALLGETIEIEATANKVGRSMAFTTIKIYKLDTDGERKYMVATASHTKYISQYQAPVPAGFENAGL